MPESRSTSSEVEVAIDPATAFTVFTDEMDLWWVRSPISFHDSARAVARRCEPGVGGRLLEVYDDTTGDALELGRITVWEPGARLAFDSSVDDVKIEVSFEPVEGGTAVRVLATVPAGGQDRGGSSWARVAPKWMGAWVARRDTTPHVPRDLARLGVAVYYAKPGPAARWLADVFGFEMEGDVPSDEDEPAWTEFHLGNCAVLVFKLDDGVPESAPVTHVPWVFVDDLDAHYARAQQRGAKIVEPVHQHGYRGYLAEDLEGHRWMFAQARPTMK